jgi:hypothetical protein
MGTLRESVLDRHCRSCHTLNKKTAVKILSTLVKGYVIIKRTELGKENRQMTSQ